MAPFYLASVAVHMERAESCQRANARVLRERVARRAHRTTMGKEYSSDITGDGPAGSVVVKHDSDITPAHGEHAPVIAIIPRDGASPAASTSSTTRSATPATGSSAHVALPDVNHVCRIPGCDRRATDTEHGNVTLCCGLCSRTDGRFHTAVCNAADYALATSSAAATVSAPVGAIDRSDFIPGWHNHNSSRPGAHCRLRPRRVPLCGTLPLPSPHRRFFCVI